MDVTETQMTYQDPLEPQPQRPPNVYPLWPTPTGTNPPRYQNVDRDGPWNPGTITAGVVVLLAVVGVIVWASNSNDQQTASNPPAQTTGQSSK
jgi:hypothetical protein